jgi:hypothetical protein
MLFGEVCVCHLPVLSSELQNGSHSCLIFGPAIVREMVLTVMTVKGTVFWVLMPCS